MTGGESLLLAFGAGIVGGAMNALAGGGTFATLPALIAIGLPSTAANATSNVALLPGAAISRLMSRAANQPSRKRMAGPSISRSGPVRTRSCW